MAFRTNPAPYQRRKVSTLQIMLILTIALAIVWVFGITYSFKLDGIVADFVKNFNEANAAAIEAGEATALSASAYGIRAILMVLVSLVVTAICDVLTTIIRHNKNSKVSLGKEIVHDLIHNYSYVTAIIFALTLPVYVSYYVVIIGAIFATVVVKNFFGGFGRNIFNPALMARIFVGLCFVSQFDVPELLKTASAGVDAVTGATLTTAFNSTGGWIATSYVNGLETVKGSIFADYTLADMLFGRYVGALGETFTLVIFALGIVLSLLKVINWRTPVFYLGTVALTSLGIALFCGLSNPLDYMMYHLCLGGVMFGAVFMLTDPVTGPTAPFGKCLIGAFAGLMTVLIRVKGGYPEGVMYSIALCNFISPAIDYFTVGKSGANLVKKICFTAGIVVISIGLNGVVAVKANGGKEVYDIGGMDPAFHALLEEQYLALNEGDHLKKIDYEIKTGTSAWDTTSDIKLKTDMDLIDPEEGTTYKSTIIPSVSNIKITDYQYTEEIKFDAVYEIENSKGCKVATSYIVSAKSAINTGYADQNVTAYLVVAINNDGSIYGINFLTPANTKKYAGQNMIQETAAEVYKGAKYDDFKNDTSTYYIAGSSYSSNFIKVMIAAAYYEFNYVGGMK